MRTSKTTEAVLVSDLLPRGDMKPLALLAFLNLAAPVIGDETASLTNGAGQTLVKIPAGKFIMGSPPEEKERGRDEDQVEVQITSPFYLAETEVTQGQWKTVMGTSIKELLATRTGPIGRGAKLVSEASAVGPDQPMVFVSWDDAIAFCKTLNDKEKAAGTLPEGHMYTLPTEAQWEYACRAGTKTAFAFGETLSSDQANFYGKIQYGIEEAGLYREKTLPVKSFQANPWGLYDMHGNVYEWCLDWYAQKAPGGKDPECKEEGDGRNIRGGTWNRKPSSCRSSYRYSANQGRRTYNIGFRIALIKVKG